MRYFLFVLVYPVLLFAGWKIEEVGASPTDSTYDIIVADGRNDGISRLYVTTSHGGIYEWTYDNGWSVQTITEEKIGKIPTVVVGDGRNDGKNRVYFCDFSFGSMLREASWSGSGWDIDTVATYHQSLSLFLGDGRNDGINRLYIGAAGNPGKGLYEYSYNGSGWDKKQLHADGMEGNGSIGKVHHDNKNRIVANYSGVKSMSWDGNDFVSDTIEFSKVWADPTYLGRGRNDDSLRVYINGSEGTAEYTYVGSSWKKKSIESGVGRGDIFVGTLHADGKERFYTTYTHDTGSNPFSEKLWNGNSYDGGRIDGLTGATVSITAGPGRNDDTTRLYLTCFKRNTIFELTSDTPYIQEGSAIKSPIKSISDNNVVVSFAGNVLKVCLKSGLSSNYSVTLCDVQGREVFAQTATVRQSTLQLPKLAKGVYIATVVLGDTKSQARVLIE